VLSFIEPKIVYSIDKCLKILEKDMTEQEAFEYFEFNVAQAYVGDQTPLWINTI
jgi:hypothetical protein